MALKLRKDVKKSSYYVWFLGAKESKGLRGVEFLLPVIKHLEEREKDVEPFKVTLQVSHKGLKIVQNIVSQGAKSKPKNETIKHFIPHNTITCVYQQEDVIACILLLFNPVTKCPLHVHAYRCDSLETAGLLKQQLNLLIERPENQKKFADIENRLLAPKETKKFESSLGSDTGTSTRESESSDERFNDNSRVTTLYDSVAAELRAKLCKKDVPILLPPRDYDTVHRQKGNLTGIELRRCLNQNIVGQNVKTGNRRIESSGGSSGIGSDHPPSPDSPDNDSRFNTIDNHSTSDEEWNHDQPDVALYLINGQSNVTLPRPSRHPESEKFESIKSDRFARYHHPEPKSPKYEDEKPYRVKSKDDEKILHSKFLFTEQDYPKQKIERQKSSDKTYDRYPERRNERPDADRIDRIDRFDFEERRKAVKDDLKFFEDKKYKYQDDDDGFEDVKYKARSRYDDEDRGRRYYDDFGDNFSYAKEKEYPVPKTRQKFVDDHRFYADDRKGDPRYKEARKFNPEDPRFYESENPKPKQEKYTRAESKPRSRSSQDEYFDDVSKRRNPESRQRSPSPGGGVGGGHVGGGGGVSPRDRFKDAKEKFLLLEKDRLEQERKMRQEAANPAQKDKYAKNYPQSKKYEYDYDDRDFKERYYEERGYDFDEAKPKAAPRSTVNDEVRYRREVPLERYRNEKYDQKRRSMFNLIEEEHKKNSSEIAKELKRRSYMESNVDDNYYRERSYGELPEDERHPGLDRDSYKFSKSSVDLDKVGDMKYDAKFVKNQKIKNAAGYRHSYAEPKLKIEKNGKKHYTEMLHRANSSVGNAGRVGIASVHPY